MSETLVAAWIAAGATIIAVPLTVMLTRAFDRRELMSLAQGRRAALSGTWMGTLEQHGEGPLDMEIHDVVMNLTARRKKVIGNGHFNAMYGGKKVVIYLTFDGGFLYDRFLKLDYTGATPGSVQFGMAVFELVPNGRELHGRYVGFGSITQRIVSGNIALSKT